DDFVRIGVFVPGAGSSATNEDFPLVEDGSFLRNFRSCNIPHPPIPVDFEVIFRLLLFAPEGAVKPKCANRTNQVHQFLSFRKIERLATTHFDRNDLLKDSQALVETDEHVSALFKTRTADCRDMRVLAVRD